MGKQKEKVAVIGEGPTEFYYIQSLVDDFRGITIKPDYPKHTSIRELEDKIKDCINDGFRYVFCIIDMDNKHLEPERTHYQKLKNKYSLTVTNKRKNIVCDVQFFETHLCTELFFYFYFTYTSRPFTNQHSLLKALNSYCTYEKKTDFFRKCKGLHSYFEKNGGHLDTAVENSERSMKYRVTHNNNYTYSELGLLIKKLRELIPDSTCQ